MTENRLDVNGAGGPVLEELRALMPSDGGEDEQVDWEAATIEWNTSFPGDYVEFMKEYGSGDISETLKVLRPTAFAPGAQNDMKRETGNALDGWPGFDFETWTDDVKPPLIAWGVNIVGDIACWNTSEQNPDNWNVAIFRAKAMSPWREYECGMAEFLRRSFSGELDECPFDDSTLWSRVPQEFVHWREEIRKLGGDPSWLIQ